MSPSGGHTEEQLWSEIVVRIEKFECKRYTLSVKRPWLYRSNLHTMSSKPFRSNNTNIRFECPPAELQTVTMQTSPGCQVWSVHALEADQHDVTTVMVLSQPIPRTQTHHETMTWHAVWLQHNHADHRPVVEGTQIQQDASWELLRIETPRFALCFLLVWKSAAVFYMYQ